MSRRSKLENAVTDYLSGHGWQPPSLRIQRSAFPGATPSKTSSSGRGRGSIVYDVEKVDDSLGIVISKVAGLKASADRRTTIDVTTGRPEHIEAVVSAAERGLMIPVIVLAMDAEIGEDNSIRLGEGKISACCVNVGEAIRTHGLVQRTQGQGKGRGNAHPVAWGQKAQKAKSGKTYVYVSVQAHLAGCGATWEKLNSLNDLAAYVEEHAEGIYL